MFAERKTWETGKNTCKEKSMRQTRLPKKAERHQSGMGKERMMLTGMSQWRQQHPTATLKEIEPAMDERLAKLRAGRVEDLVKMSPQGDWSQRPAEDRPVCEQCGKPLQRRGKRSRWVHTSGGEQIEIERSDGTCPDDGRFAPSHHSAHASRWLFPDCRRSTACFLSSS
jgi:hypothetical protein